MTESPTDLHDRLCVCGTPAQDGTCPLATALVREFLTVAERRVVELLAEAWDLLAAEVVSGGRPAQQDLAELGGHVHAIQNAVLAQAAARAYPGTYRLLGKSLRSERQRQGQQVVIHRSPEPETRVVVVPVPHEPWLRR